MPTKKPKQPKSRTPRKHLPEPVPVPVKEPAPPTDYAPEPPPFVPPRHGFTKRCKDWLVRH